MASRGVSRDVQHSKALSYLLRHGAEKEGLKMTKDGFVKADDLLSHKSLRGVTYDEIIKIVENCPKKRFHIEYLNDDGTKLTEDSTEDDRTLFVRANQGHSIKDIEVEMKKIDADDQITECIHGTYMKAWPAIKTQGLSKMSRQHVHLSEDFPGSKKVISGMRSNCQVAVFIDVKKAMKDGLEFFRSENNVILCPGDANGFIKPKYFSRVLNLQTDALMNDYDKSD